jgi:hypothetical protein
LLGGNAHFQANFSISPFRDNFRIDDTAIPGLPVIECQLEAAVRDLYQMKHSGAGAGSMRISANPDTPFTLV